jgi:hypothetical protein
MRCVARGGSGAKAAAVTAAAAAVTAATDASRYRIVDVVPLADIDQYAGIWTVAPVIEEYEAKRSL